MKTKTALFTFLTIILSVTLFSGCTKAITPIKNNLGSKLNTNLEENNQESALKEMTPEEETQAVEEMEEPLTTSDELDDLEAELDATLILDEDFSDLE